LESQSQEIISTVWFLPLLAVSILLLLAAFFSAAETGLTAVAKARIFQLASENNRRAKMVLKLRAEKEALISAVLLGSNLVTTLSSAIATSLAIALWGNTGVVYATAIMTVLLFVFAEVLPKSYALQHAERVALAVAPLIAFTVKILTPFNVGIKWMVGTVFKLLRIDMRTEITETSVNEVLRGTIDMHHQEGQMKRHDRDMLGGILELEEITVEDAMIHRKNLEAISIDQPPMEILRQAINSSHSRIPLYRGDFQQIVGVLHMKNLLRLIDQKGRAGITNSDLQRISTKPWFIPSTTTLKEQLHAFRQQRQHFALVVDEYGALLGIVTLEDVIEEIVGEIDDEYDTIDPNSIVQIEPNVWLVDGGVGIRDLNRYLNWELSDEDANTIAGLILHKARDIPELGAEFMIEDIRFTVEARTASQITRLRIEPLTEHDVQE
jgi:Mg2+/Co2+ transporter CorB